MGEIAVTVVTRDADLDALHPDDYREIYDEIRGYRVEEDKYAVSLDAFVGLVHSQFSKAAWSKYHRGELELNRTMRNELRRAVGMPDLTPSVAEVTAEVDPNALVVRVGEGVIDRLVMVAGHEPMTVAVNGSVRAWVMDAHEDAPIVDVTAVTAPRRRRASVSLRPDVFERYNSLRVAHGLTWEELLELAWQRLEPTV